MGERSRQRRLRDCFTYGSPPPLRPDIACYAPSQHSSPRVRVAAPARDQRRPRPPHAAGSVHARQCRQCARHRRLIRQRLQRRGLLAKVEGDEDGRPRHLEGVNSW